MIAVILISALLIGAKTHNLSVKVVAALALMDFAITIFFVIEIVYSIFGLPRKEKIFS